MLPRADPIEYRQDAVCVLNEDSGEAVLLRQRQGAQQRFLRLCRIVLHLLDGIEQVLNALIGFL